MTQPVETTTLAVHSAPVTGLPDLGEVEAQLTTINRFQAAVHRLLKEGSDYGAIPGTGSKPTLLKPGAEKITKLLGAEARYTVSPTIDWQQHPPFFSYDVTCEIYQVGTDVRLASGVGNCNSWESKYRYRRQERGCPACGGEYIIKGKQEYGGGWLCYRAKGGCGAKYDDGDPAIESQPQGRTINEDTADLVNTILKMAKKRAQVDAALGFAVLSDVFTQDLEDMPQNGSQATQQPPQQPPQARSAEPAVYGYCDYHGDDMTFLTRNGTPLHRIGAHFCTGDMVLDKDGAVVEYLADSDDADDLPEPPATETTTDEQPDDTETEADAINRRAEELFS